jgi:hypothetical protein
MQMNGPLVATSHCGMDFVNGTMIEIDGGQQKPLMDRFRDR